MRLLSLFFSFIVLYADILPINILPPLEDRNFMGIKILDQKQLWIEKIDNIKFSQLSDITYDKKTNILYMVSDKGALFSFDAQFSDKIDSLNPLKASELKDKKSKLLKTWKRDGEGLTLDGQGHLLISFEGEAKIGWFHKNSEKYGSLIRHYTLPKQLTKIESYRSKNKSLESLAWHTKYGVLTATEWPLKKDDKKKQTIYALSGKEWYFKAEPEAKSAVVSMEVMDDGNMLVLERSYTGMLEPFVVTLKKVILGKGPNSMCESKVLIKMNTHKGWNIDNFEGLAKVGKNRYVMISDDNDNFFQKTLLIYFEVI